MDVGEEHIRETRAKILAAKKEIKEYLRLPEDARGLLILTHIFKPRKSSNGS